MKKLRLLTTALAASVLITGGSVPALAASTQEKIEAVQEGKAQSESDLAEAQQRLEDLENQRGDLETYLSQLSQQYEEIRASLQDLTDKAKQKQEELRLVKKELKKAKKREEQQYESMKIRISYMYENSRGSLLTTLLSADGLTDMLSRAENFAQISRYDREMLKKYEQSIEKVQDQKLAVKVEQEAIAALQAQTDQKRQEVEALSVSTQEKIESYGQEIDRAEGEAANLLDLVNSQSAQLDGLMAQAQEEAEAARRAAEAELARQQQEEKEREQAEAARAAQQAQESIQEETVQEGDEPEISAQETQEPVADQEESEEIQEPEALQEPEESESSVQETPEPEAAKTQTPETTAQPEEKAQPEPTAEPEPAQTEPETTSSGSAGTYLGDFTLTAYCSCSICCGSWSGGGTASGTTPTAGRTVAMGGVPFGTKLLINGNVYTVEDRGTGYGHVDIFMDSHSAALRFGSQRASVYQLNN